MQKIENAVNDVVDFTNTVIEKVSSPASRAGSTVERAGKMLEEGVDSDVIALQMTKNSTNSISYTSSDVNTLGKIYKESKTKVILTSKQTRSLIKDQQDNNQHDGNLVTQS